MKNNIRLYITLFYSLASVITAKAQEIPDTSRIIKYNKPANFGINWGTEPVGFGKLSVNTVFLQKQLEKTPAEKSTGIPYWSAEMELRKWEKGYKEWKATLPPEIKFGMPKGEAPPAPKGGGFVFGPKPLVIPTKERLRIEDEWWVRENERRAAKARAKELRDSILAIPLQRAIMDSLLPAIK